MEKAEGVDDAAPVGVDPQPGAEQVAPSADGGAESTPPSRPADEEAGAAGEEEAGAADVAEAAPPDEDLAPIEDPLALAAEQPGTQEDAAAAAVDAVAMVRPNPATRLHPRQRAALPPPPSLARPSAAAA